ncbi:MAG TPA: hypothetical protein VFC82_03725 [Actinomycetaceae bacterium]|nr:hypothetical protein [Actinomycetaceae bacterium]
MVAPLLIPLGAVLVAGVVAAGKGASDFMKAESVGKDASARHAIALAGFEVWQTRTQTLAESYGREQLRAQAETIGRFVAWMEANEQLVERLDRRAIQGIEVQIPSLPEMKFDVRQATIALRGGFGAASAAVSAQGAALWGISTFASASTGTAISGLTGAAATNATLAWLGGGSLAAGGGGIAAGTIVLNMIAVAPAALVGGLTLNILGMRQKSNAAKFSAEVNVSIGSMAKAQALLEGIQDRIRELRSILRSLVSRSEQATAVLEGVDFDPDLHAVEFVQALQLVTAIGEVIDTPVADPDSGQLTEESIRIVEKYS